MRATMAVLVACLLAACGGAAHTATTREVATPLPALTLPLLDGGTWSSASARGSALVIDVWASWCKPCSKGFPKLDALAARRHDVTVVAITIDDDPAAIRAFVAQFPIGVQVVHDVDKQVTRPPIGVTSLPALLIVDGDGIIRHRIEKPTEQDYDRIDGLVDGLAPHTREASRTGSALGLRFDP
jgi:thiol-disulfide isomerase/thioredoxin